MNSPRNEIVTALHEAGHRMLVIIRRGMRVGKVASAADASTHKNPDPPVPAGIGAGALFRYLFTCRYPGRPK